ncbi:hypothetical protein ACVWZV_002219 [Bradyrhizobium sp. GM5.1]
MSKSLSLTEQLALIGMVFAMCLTIVMIGGGTAYANPSFFAVGTTTNGAASTSPAFMTPGTATSTTPVHNALAQTLAGGATSKTDFVGLLVRFCGSSTLATLNIAQEHSEDNIDWFRNFVVDPMTIAPTSSTPWLLTSSFSTRWQFASSSLQGRGTLDTCSTAALVVPTPFQYTRFVSSITGANGSVWMQVVPIKQQK